MADYNSAYTGAEIDQGVGNGLAAPTTYAPIAHDSAATTYGKGTASNYGHLKLSDSTSSTSGTSGGIAATPSAVKAAYDLANGKQSPATTLAGYGITDAASSADLGTFVRPNLLDNAYFVGGGSQQGGGQLPINQRGATSYTANGYTIDRWKANAANVTLSADKVTLSTTATTTGRSIRQSPENSKDLYGKTVTLSVLFGNVTANSVYIGIMSGTSPLAATGIIAMSGTATNGALLSVTALVNDDFTVRPYITALIGFQNNGASGTAEIMAAKLEIGSTQTLAHQENGTWVLNEIPNFEAELAKCQRYAYRNSNMSSEIVRAGNLNANEILFEVPCPVTMRTNPTYSAMTSTDALSVRSYNGAAQTGFTFSIIALGSSIRIIASKTSHGLTDANLAVTGTLFSADL